MDLRLLQGDVAKRLGADTTTVTNWELGHTAPALRWMPGIIRFLGYDPRPEPRTIGEALKHYRHSRGMTQEELAVRLEVDPSTLARWEREERIPAGDLLKRVQSLLRTVSAYSTLSTLPNPIERRAVP